MQLEASRGWQLTRLDGGGKVNVKKTDVPKAWGGCVTYCIFQVLKFDALKSRGLTAWLWLSKNASWAKVAMKPSTRPGLAWPIWARLGLAHGFRPGLAQPYEQRLGEFVCKAIGLNLIWTWLMIVIVSNLIVYILKRKFVLARRNEHKKT